jgi:F-type H+-transporting ATPase subunit b
MDETAWVAVAFLLFVGMLVYLKVPGLLTKGLDDRAAKIRSDLEEAARLRSEAQKLFAEYQEKQKNAMKEAAEIVAHAQEEAKRLAAQAEADLKASLTRRQAMAEQKIAQAEQAAVQDVRGAAVDLAVEAARAVLMKTMQGGAAQSAADKAIADVRTLIH